MNERRPVDESGRARARRLLARAGSGAHLLFVCTGNTCRSPMADALARREARRRGFRDVGVRSAGTYATPGSPASGGALRTAQRHGVDLSGHRSAPLTRELLDWADVIVGMTETHVNVARRLSGEGDRVVLLTELLDEEHPRHGRSVEDPVGGPGEAYERAFEVIEAAVGRLFEGLAHGGDGEDGNGR